MSTPCIIATRLENLSYRLIYCQNDGYDSGNGAGPNLRRFFSDQERAEVLTALGDISCLWDGKATAYHRDLGESWAHNQPRFADTLSSVRLIAWQTNVAYLYVFEGGHWHRHDIR
ncbi:MAG TPA: hypothetical protein PKE57_07490 [Cellvibrionaceae bacterium]|nr:hypothetical protein [Cellvibrionaceae bacterium]HMW48026.1 hypothetical protein [Cellvibrionaceae bacterium]HMW71067.1 hypothetical protein [Cellvibrionaceae bacterium]HNG61996.1 hypothetical protein [Cellvibrionaceae bacterium]